MLKELPQKLLRELLKNSKRSDRELAKFLNVSQPTITRIRHELEKNEVIENYTIIPNFRKIGFELMAINLVKVNPEILAEAGERAKDFVNMFSNMIFSSTGEGMGMNAVSITFYKNYTEYHDRMNLVRREWKDIIKEIQSFLIPVNKGEFKRFSMTHLKDVPF